MPALSVVIPLFNKRPHIQRALKSICSQTVLPDEIIVVDDGSTDSGGDVVAAFSAPGLRLITQDNQGPSSARNRGVAESRGELIAFLDADDAWNPGFLQAILALQEQYPQAGAYATAYTIISPEGKEIQNNHRILPDAHHGLIDNYYQTALHSPMPPIWTSATAVPRKVLGEIGGFPATEFLGEDLDTWLRIVLSYPIAWSSENLAIYYQNATNRTCVFKYWLQEPAVSCTARQAIAQGLVPSEAVQDLRDYVARIQMAAARDCLIHGKKEVALQLLDHARQTRKFARNWWKWRLLAALPGNPSPWLLKLKQEVRRKVGGWRLLSKSH